MSSESTQESSLLTEIAAGMKESPIETAGEKEPGRKVLYDGYVRSTKEQDMYMTDKYRHRYIRMALYLLFALVLIALVLILLFK